MIKMRSKTTTKDTGEKKLFKELNRLKKGPGVKIGVLEKAGPKKDHDGQESSDGLTVAAVATYNEYGTDDGHIPERSFIRSTMSEHEDELLDMTRDLKSQVISGKMKIERALGLLGEKIKSLIQAKITAISDPPNAPSTIAAKGSSHPLIDSSQMRQSITYALVMDGKKEGKE